MRFKLASENGAKRLPKPVKEYMKRRFTLLPSYFDLLRCFEYDGLVNEKRVRCIRIFSPNRAREHRLLITTNQDLGQYPEMLLFEGYINSQGGVYVADRRSPIVRRKAT